MKNRIKLIALILGLLVALAFPLSGAGANAVVDPNEEYCQDKDGAGGIMEQTKEYISDRNHNLEKNCKGAQICVLVLESIGSQRIEDYSAMVFEKWKIGQNGENNGVLLLMAIENKDYYILSGSGLSSVLSVKTLSSISRNAIEPYFKEGNYDAAVLAGFERLNEAVCNHYKVDPLGSAEGHEFSGGGSGIFDLDSGFSWLNGELPAGPILDCVSCIFSCGSCACGSCACGSCGGFGGLALFAFVAYFISQVLKYKTSSGANRVSGVFRSFANANSNSNSGQQRSSNAHRPSGRHGYTSHRPPFTGSGRGSEKK